jgi:hypothetical protein
MLLDSIRRAVHAHCHMSTRTGVALLLLCSVMLVGCRQPDGPMPDATVQTMNRLDDLGRDLQNVAVGIPSAPGELSGDLSVFVEEPATVEAVETLADLVAEALVGVELSEERAAQLSNNLWIVVVAQELSETQMESVREELRLDLLSIGASDTATDAVAAQVSNTQELVLTRSRRWFEVF